MPVIVECLQCGEEFDSVDEYLEHVRNEHGTQ